MGYVDHFNADSAADISESFEPSSGRDYQHVSVIHLKPRPIRALRTTSKREKKKKKGVIKKPFHLIANLRYTIFFWPNFTPYISGNLGVLRESAWNKKKKSLGSVFGTA